MRRTPAFWEFDTVGVETGKRAGVTREWCAGLLSLNSILWARGSPSQYLPVLQRWAPNGGPSEAELVIKSIPSWG